MFVSGLTERDEQLTAFQSGGDDFIAKPFDVEILRAKVGALIQRYRRQQFIRNPNADTQAFDHLRRVNHYLLTALKVSTLGKLNDATLEALSALDIKAALYIHKKPELLASSCGSLTDLETQLLSQTKGAQMQALGAIYAGSAQAAWLIQNMPRAGTQEFARLHDALLIMFDAYSQKVQTLLVKFAQEASPTPRGISPSTEMLMGQLAELDDATDDAVSECLNQLQLLQNKHQARYMSAPRWLFWILSCAGYKMTTPSAAESLKLP